MTKQKEFLVNHDNKWTLQLLDSDTEENIYRVAVPSGATFYAEDSNMGVKDNYFFRLRCDDFDDEAIYLSGRWVRAFFDVRNMTVLWQRHTQSETDYLMQGANAKHLKQSISELKQPEELPFIDDEPKYSDNPLLTQVGGDHYKSLPIQPVEFAMKNNLDYCQANAIKYIVRHANKNGKQDLEKAKHYIDLLIQYHYSEDA